MKWCCWLLAATVNVAHAGQIGAGTENRQWLQGDATPVALLPGTTAALPVAELHEDNSGLTRDPVTGIWGIPVPRLGDPDYAPGNLGYTGVVRDAPLVLPARVYAPHGRIDRAAPCILITNGYGVGNGDGAALLREFSAHGYTSIEVALRQASSEPQHRQIGVNGYYSHYGADGVAIINELVRRYGCGMTGGNPNTAKVGMVGASLLGGSQWAVVSRPDYPAALKAIVPDSPGIHHKTYSTLWYPGGMLPGPMRVARPGQELSANYPAHRDFDAYWNDLQLSSAQLRAAASRRLAVLFTGGWYEYNTPGNLDAYVAFNALSGPTNKRLVVAPSAHTLPDWLYRPLAIQWMARWLKDETTDAAQPPVLLYIRGADRWRAEQSWPITDATTVTLALSPKHSGTIDSRNDGSLTPAGNMINGVPAQYDYDPVAGPFLHVMVPGGTVLRETADRDTPVYNSPGFIRNMAGDDRKTVTWTSAALTQPMEIAGNPVLRFWASSSIDDADFVASLTDVAPDGSSALIIQGYLNGPREAYTRPDPLIAPPTPLTPGVPRQFTLRLNPTAYVVPAGHRIRIAIAGGAELALDQRQAQGPGRNPRSFTVNILQTREKRPSLELPVIGEPDSILSR